MPNVGIEEDMPLDFMAFEAISGACKTKHFGPKSSAYDLNLLSIAQCKKSKYWSNPEQGNSWYESILTEVQTLLRFKVYTVVNLATFLILCKHQGLFGSTSTQMMDRRHR